MQCASFREAVSARLDDEPLGMPATALDAHLADCRECSTWAEDAAAVTRRTRLAPALPVPDLTAAVLAALPRDPAGAAARRRARWWAAALRCALLAVGLAQAALAWPELGGGMLVGGMAMPAPTHLTHETAAWNLGVAVAFLAVGVAPRLAAGALPFLGTFTALLTAVTAADLVADRVPADRALGHLLLLAGVALVAVLAWRSRRRRTTRAVARGRAVA